MARTATCLLLLFGAILCASNFENAAAAETTDEGSKLQKLPEPFLCVYVARHLQHLLNYNYTKEEISQQARNLCQFLPTELKSHCHQNIQQGTLKLIESLEKANNVQDFCYKNILATKANQLPSAISFTNCSICKLYFSIFEKAISKPSEVKMLTNTLIGTVCAMLEGKAQAKCIDVAREVFPYVLKAILSLPPRVLCFVILNTCTGPNDQANAMFANQVDTMVPNKCIFGPIYGCLNYKTMKNCNSEKHCLPLMKL